MHYLLTSRVKHPRKDGTGRGAALAEAEAEAEAVAEAAAGAAVGAEAHDRCEQGCHPLW